jgi:arsenate reductase
MKTKILILCTDNSCRSQMAEGILCSLDARIQVFSAGTQPASRVSSKAISVMKEIGIDISSHIPKNVDQFLSASFDYLITVCDHAKETCPVFIGKVKHRLHLGFENPAEVQGTDEEIIAAFRRIRDGIKITFSALYSQTLVKEVT